MALSETALIERYFRSCGAQRADVTLGVGDDAALLECPTGHTLVASIDTLVAGVHFPLNTAPRALGHRALAVNLSDLAAMGARPAWALLALTLPAAEESWLREFAGGFDALAQEHEVALIGGDTTRGPLCISVQVLGHLPRGSALTRSGARAADVLFVSGSPGDAAAGLALEEGRLQAAAPVAAYLRERFLKPTPRVALGERLRELAHACIDVSDGLLGDAGKLATASGLGVQIEFEALPVSAALCAAVGEARARELALSGGDDYELCFAIAAPQLAQLAELLPPREFAYARIGVLSARAGARVTHHGTVMDFSHSGYQHFS
jgi:thiamine-monophosphate kinase